MPSPMEGVLGEGRVATGSSLPNALPHAFPGLLGRVGRNDPPDFFMWARHGFPGRPPPDLPRLNGKKAYRPETIRLSLSLLVIQ